MVENFAARLKQAILVNKSDNKITSFNKHISSNKTKHLVIV